MTAPIEASVTAQTRATEDETPATPPTGNRGAGELVITAYGNPAPQGSKSGFAVKRGGVYTGRVAMKESSDRVKPWRETVKHAAIDAHYIHLGAPTDNATVWGGRTITRRPMDGPLCITMIFTLRKPKSAPKRRRTWPDRTPDLSKLARAAEDALVDAGVIADDARIVEYDRLAKVFPGEDIDALDSPGVQIRIRQVAP